MQRVDTQTHTKKNDNEINNEIHSQRSASSSQWREAYDSRSLSRHSNRNHFRGQFSKRMTNLLMTQKSIWLRDKKGEKMQQQQRK